MNINSLNYEVTVKEIKLTKYNVDSTYFIKKSTIFDVYLI